MRYALPILLIVAAAAAADDRVELVDARIVSGRLLAVTPSHVRIRAGGKTQDIPLADVASIYRAGSAVVAERAGKPMVVTAAGGIIAAQTVTVKEGVVTVSSASLGRMTLKVSAVKAAYFPPATATPADVQRRCRELRMQARREDLLVAQRKDGQYVSLPGAIKSVDAAHVVFTRRGSARTTELPAVRAIMLASLEVQRPRIIGTLTVTDGSSIPLESVAFKDSVAVVKSPGAETVRVRGAVIARIEFLSDRVVRLSDLKPARVKEYGFFGRTFAHRLNRAVSGRALTLGGRAYASGIGLHSFASLTYALDAKYRTFVATVGIDDAVRPNGNATLTFLGDGKPIGEPRVLTGSDKPLVVRLDIKGVKEFTLQVDFGPDDLDVADHVDLAAARLVK